MNWRLLIARILVVLAAIFALLSLVAGFIRYQGLDTKTVEETAELMLADEQIRDQLATRLVEGIYTNVNVAGALEQRLPEQQQGLAPVVAGAMRELSDRAAQRLLEQPRSQELWVRSVSELHEQLLRVLDDDLTAVQTEGGYLVLNLRPLVVQLGDRVAIVGRLANRLPGDAGYIRVMEANQLETAQDATQILKSVGGYLFLVPLALAALALWLARGRRRSILLMLGVALVVVGLLVLVARSVGGAYVVDNLVKTESARPAAAGRLGHPHQAAQGQRLVDDRAGRVRAARRLADRRRLSRDGDQAQARPLPRPARVGLRRHRGVPAPSRLVGSRCPVPPLAARAHARCAARDRRRGAAAVHREGRPGGVEA